MTSKHKSNTSLNKKVFVAMSGGVDSSVTAALLQQAGYRVFGVFIKIDLSADCVWRAERREAMRAAAKLGLPFMTFDLTEDYRQAVVDNLMREYRAGHTPNPDVMCNKQIKFGVFYEEAVRRGADLMATGHYARKKFSATNACFQLLTAKDQEKDQTYFLWAIKQTVLTKCLFPLGVYQKTVVRRLAKKFGLPNADKPDSQGLCFVGQIDFKNFLTKFLPEQTGSVLDEQSEIIGSHRGTHFYTIGERHGFKINRPAADNAIQTPLYVVAKNMGQNTLTVAPAERVVTNWSAREIALRDVNWLANRPILGKNYLTRTRYRASLVPCRLAEIKDDRIKLILGRPQSGLAPGQSAVIYDGEICLGGGVIA